MIQRTLQFVAKAIVVIFTSAFAAPITGCRDRAHLANSSAYRVGELRVSRRSPLAWRRDPELLQFLRVDLFGTGDVARITCDSTGIFGWDPSGNVSPLRVGVAACERLWRATEVALSPDGTRAFLALPGQAESVQLNLADFSRLSVQTTCSPRTFAWSRLGDRVAVVEACTESLGDQGLLEILKSNGTSDSTLQIRGVVGRASWSPDGQSIAYTRQSTSGEPLISIVSLADGASRVIARGTDPAWSPTGESIAYLAIDRTRPMSNEIRTIRADGRSDRRIAKSADASQIDRVFSGPMVWSLTSDKIAVARAEQLVIISVTDSARAPIRVH
jgi:WD40-like Beta Propeller Repeat